MTMDGKGQSTNHSLGFRGICILLLAAAVCMLVVTLIDTGVPPPMRSIIRSLVCHQDRLPTIYRMMRDVPGETSDLPSEWTVADLIREAVRRDRQNPHPTPESRFRCKAVEQPYLVFPVSASVVFDESLQPPVPILACPPGEHDKSPHWFRKPPKWATPPGHPWEYGTPVLYSDGSILFLSTEDAEKLVAEQHPVPLKLDSEAQNEVKP